MVRRLVGTGQPETSKKESSGSGPMDESCDILHSEQGG